LKTVDGKLPEFAELRTRCRDAAMSARFVEGNAGVINRTVVKARKVRTNGKIEI
jgi:hypothetical protein